MKSCAFFGHGKHDYRKKEVLIEKIIFCLIQEYGVTEFYAGGRGAFDHTCARIVHKLKEEYPQIKMTKVFSYIPKDDYKYALPYYDDTIYLLERYVPPKYAIIETNKALVNRVDFILSGVEHSWGGATMAVEYAYKRKKRVFELTVEEEKDRKEETKEEKTQ